MDENGLMLGEGCWGESRKNETSYYGLCSANDNAD